MSEKMIYRGYSGSVRYSAEDQCYVGKIQGITDCVLYEGATKDELQKDFEEAVDDYVRLCVEIGKEAK